MVGVLEHNHIFATRVRPRQSQRQFVRLAAGVHKKTDPQWFWQPLYQPLGVAIHVVVQIARVGVEQRELLLRRSHNARMAVPHQRHVVVRVEIRPPRIIVEIVHPAAHDFQGALVGNAEIFSQKSAPLFERVLKTCLASRESVLGNPEQKIRIGRKAGPHSAL